jgi:transmembrane sensor
MNHSERIGFLMYRYMRNELSKKENKELLAWRNQSAKHETAFQEATDWENVQADLQHSEKISRAVLEKVKEKVPGPWLTEEYKPKAKVRLMTHLMRAAAIIIFGLSFIGYSYSAYQNGHPHPGTYAGMFDGSSGSWFIPIGHDMVRGFKAGKANLDVVEHDNGDIDYVATNDPKRPDKINNVQTYRGNSFVLRLPGMASIRVNASTTLWYPAKFDADTLRIKLTGEAYFDMAPNKVVEIEVRSTVNGQQSTILQETGSFNVHAYPADSLKVSRDEQSAAWNNKMIEYRDASLKTILDEISRWYDVSVVYEGHLPDGKYNIKLPRNAAFTEVIDALKKQGANLYVNRKNIYVQ